MPLRGRALVAGARAAAVANERRLLVAARLLLLAALVFVAVRLRSLWHSSHVELAGAGWAALAGAFLLSAAGVAASGFAWLAILRRLGVATRPSWAGAFFQGQLAKYIPGTVWQYAGRAALARSCGIPLRPVAVSLPVELGASLAAAGVLATLLLGAWGIALAGVLLAVGAAVARRDGVPVSVRVAAAVVPLYALLSLVTGTGFWLTARSLLGVPFGDVLVYVGAFWAAWAVGLVAIFAPGGIGVREAMLLAILRGRLGSADALVLAAVSRGVLTAVDFSAAGAGVLLLRRAGRS
jgi:glycosyltransferase 2 family protein